MEASESVNRLSKGNESPETGKQYKCTDRKNLVPIGSFARAGGNVANAGDVTGLVHCGAGVVVGAFVVGEDFGVEASVCRDALVVSLGRNGVVGT